MLTLVLSHALRHISVTRKDPPAVQVPTSRLAGCRSAPPKPLLSKMQRAQRKGDIASVGNAPFSYFVVLCGSGGGDVTGSTPRQTRS